MWRKICLAFVVAVIGGAIMTIIEVDAQSTVDDSASCESSTFDEAVNLIREDLKNYVRSDEQQNNVSCVSKRDLEDLKAAYASNQQQINESCIPRNDFADLKAAYASLQQQINESFISRKDFEDLKTACASNRQKSCTVNVSTSCE